MANTRISSEEGIDKVKSGAVIGGVVNPAAGRVGEILSVASHAAGISHAVGFTAATLSLSKGVWDVSGMLDMSAVGANPVMVAADVGTLANSTFLGCTSLQLGGATYSTGATGALTIPSPTRRIVLDVASNVYLTGLCYFGAGTMATTANGNLTARRAA